MDPRRTPERIRSGHPADQQPNLGIELRPSGPSTRLASPVASESLAVPTNDSLRLDDHQRPLPIGPSVPKGDPEGSIEIGKGKPTLRRGVQDRELMAEGQVLESEFAPALEGSSEGMEQHSDEAKHGRRGYSGMAKNACQCWADGFTGGTP